MTNSQHLLDETETKTETRHCDKHGEYEAELFRIADRWLGGNCKRCDEEREQEREDAIREERKRTAREYRDRLHARSGIPKRFEGRTLADYRADSDGQKRALRISQRIAEGGGDGASAIFCGKPGTGKTHLACGIAREWIEAGKPASFATVLSAIRFIKSTYNSASEMTEEQAIEALTGVDLLILDEVGAQLGTEHEKMLLFEIINERYQEMLSTILISNLTKDELTDYLGDRVMDRFRENGAVVAFDWNSYRGANLAKAKGETQ